jgi:hypothetical protein
MRLPRGTVRANGFPFHHWLDDSAKRPEMVSFEAGKINTSHIRPSSLALSICEIETPKSINQDKKTKKETSRHGQNEDNETTATGIFCLQS